MTLQELETRIEFEGAYDNIVEDVKSLMKYSWEAAITYWLSDSTQEAGLAFQDFIKRIQ